MRSKSFYEAKLHVESFSDYFEREIAEANLFRESYIPEPKKHFVVLLHGMNTNAEWQEALAEPLRNDSGLEPVVVGYGNFHPVKFWFPFYFRPGRIQKVLIDLEGIRERETDADISIVAHSFGTYIVSKILSRTSRIKFHRILLCGSIISSDFNWSSFSKQFSQPVLNDIGQRDRWPCFAKSCTWGFGNSGSIGFQNSLVRDRHFTYEHSGFLNVRHMTRYWLPYLVDGKIVSSRYSQKRKPLGLRESLLRWFPFKYLILLILAGIVAGLFHFVAWIFG